ncbi:MAG: phosphotransferase [Acidiferrobacterales bacterium]|nr:phosphotransferase [Acidiferrobacterales bacterium]
MDDRLQALRLWLEAILDIPIDEIHPASADASFRRYFRVHAGGATYIAMDAPPDKYNAHTYVRIARHFRSIGLNVPRVLHIEAQRGFLVLTDLGDEVYLAQLNGHTVGRLYGDAMRALRLLQQDGGMGAGLPDYDLQLLLAEMELFPEWYLGRHLGIRLTRKQQGVLDRTFGSLARCALDQPRVCVHRDYHSRNLLVRDEHNPGIVDFQDAVRGPVTYDLVSLLRDCYIAWPQARVEAWAREYHDAALHAGIPVGEDPDRFLRWFDWMGVQRHLKAAGIFARLRHRDNKPGYLQDIPRTLGYVLEVSAHHADLQPLHTLLRDLRLTDMGTPSEAT